MRAKSTTERNRAAGISNIIIPWNLVYVKPLPNYRIEVEFADGVHGVVDYSRKINSNHAGIFAKLKDINAFNLVQIIDGIATWPYGVDVCSDTMHDKVKNNDIWIV